MVSSLTRVENEVYPPPPPKFPSRPCFRVGCCSIYLSVLPDGESLTHTHTPLPPLSVFIVFLFFFSGYRRGEPRVEQSRNCGGNCRSSGGFDVGNDRVPASSGLALIKLFILRSVRKKIKINK